MATLKLMTRTTSERARVPVAGISISHPTRVIYPDLGLTKLDVARYYDAVADRMLRHLVGRPLTLLRCGGAIDSAADKGGCVMLRHGKAWGPKAIRRVQIPELRKTGEYLVADTRAALVGLAQMGVVEIHTWNARAETPYEHDRVVIDLDPGPEVPWKDVAAAATLVRQLLADVRLKSWVKTTGGKGLHFVLPITRRHTWLEIREFARGLADALVGAAPSLFTAKAAREARPGRVYVDYLRNAEGATAVAAYSLRARPGLPVSMPIAFDELDRDVRGDHFNIDNAVDTLAHRHDPWADYEHSRQTLSASMRRAVHA